MNTLIRRLSSIGILVLTIGLLVSRPAAADDPTDPSLLKQIYVGSGCVTPIKGRFIGSKGEDYTYSYYKSKYKDMQPPKETPRLTVFAKDVQTLLGSVTKLGAAGATSCVTETYKLENVRATLTLTPEPKDTNDTNVVKSADVTTGPREHWSLGLNLPISNSKTLKYDSSTQTLQPQDTNPQLYLSADYLIGDTASDPKEVPPLERFTLKGMVLASSRPLDSLGLAAGYRFPTLSALGLDLSSLSVFGGYFWTKQDTIVNGVSQPNGQYKTAWRFGITFDLATALKWVKW